MYYHSQMQKMIHRLDRLHDLALDDQEFGLFYLLDLWNVRDDQPQRALQHIREVGHNMQPSFSQLRREGANFLFLQQRLIKMWSGSFPTSRGASPDRTQS